MKLEQMRTALAKVFGVSEGYVHVVQAGPEITVTVERNDDEAPFTFAQMMQLPAIFGTEHIDFSNEAGSSHGSSWTGIYGHYNNLIIKARNGA